MHGPSGQINQVVAPDGPVDCSYGQSGKVWFLAGTFFNSAATGPPTFTATRSCTVPPGTMLFLPVVNNEFDNLAIPPNPPTTFTLDQLRAQAKANMDAVSDMAVIIDGRSVKGIATSSTAYRVTSTFQYWLPTDNIVSVALGTTIPPGPVPSPGATGDGVYVMLRPLSPGVHHLHWEGGIPGSFSQDINYTITVG